MEFNITQNEETAVLTLQGDLTIQNAAGLLDALKEVQEFNKAIDVRLAEGTEVDCSTLQLFCSAHRTAVANEQRMSITAEDPAALSDYTAKAGYRRGRGCVFGRGTPCLWCEDAAYE